MLIRRSKASVFVDKILLGQIPQGVIGRQRGAMRKQRHDSLITALRASNTDGSNVGRVIWDLIILWQWYQIQNNTEMLGLQHKKHQCETDSDIKCANITRITSHKHAFTAEQQWTRHLVGFMITTLNKEHEERKQLSQRGNLSHCLVLESHYIVPVLSL